VPIVEMVPAFPAEQVRGLKTHRKTKEGDAGLNNMNVSEH